MPSSSPRRSPHRKQGKADHHHHQVQQATTPVLNYEPPSPTSSSSSRNDTQDQKRTDERTHLLGEQNRIANSSPIPSIHHDESQQTKSLWYLVLLTISIGGLQIAWSVELSNGSPYLLSLGLSKSLMALVWIAGPLTGTLVQPYVGMLSDNCRLPWGKRKPFMIGGTLATVLSLLFLAWAKEIVGGILSLFGADPDSQPVKVTIICAAVVGIYILDFAINTVQAAIRAFMVDCAPAHQQEAVNAMASRIIGFGNIIGYCAGYVNLPECMWFFGDTQFKILCAIACIALGATVFVSTALISERDPRFDGPPKAKPGVFSFFARIFTSIKRLPPQIKRVCQVQFCAWIGFFPLLFYTSSYIGEIYVEPFLRENPNRSPEELDELYEQATRVGTFALLINSIVSLLTNVFLPFFIAPTYDVHPSIGQGPGQTHDDALRPSNHSSSRWLDRLHIPGFTLKRAWFGSLILFALSMFCTVLVRTVEAATVLIGLAGITWAMTLWAPWAIISAEISRRDVMLRAARQRYIGKYPATGTGTGTGSPTPRDLTPDSDEEIPQSPDEEVDQAGVILGIHNMAIAAPQVIATVGSSIIFRIWQKPRGVPGDHSIAIVLALGGVAVLVSSFFVAGIHETTSVAGDVISAAEEGGRDGAGVAKGDEPQHTYEQFPRFTLNRSTLSRNLSLVGVEY